MRFSQTTQFPECHRGKCLLCTLGTITSSSPPMKNTGAGGAAPSSHNAFSNGKQRMVLFISHLGARVILTGMQILKDTCLQWHQWDLNRMSTLKIIGPQWPQKNWSKRHVKDMSVSWFINNMLHIAGLPRRVQLCCFVCSRWELSI